MRIFVFLFSYSNFFGKLEDICIEIQCNESPFTIKKRITDTCFQKPFFLPITN